MLCTGSFAQGLDFATKAAVAHAVAGMQDLSSGDWAHLVRHLLCRFGPFQILRAKLAGNVVSLTGT